MKGTIGYFLFAVGLGGIVGGAIKDVSGWIIMLFFVSLFIGLEMIIGDKINTAKEEIRNELDK